MKNLVLSSVISLALVGAVSAETREQCEANLRPASTRAIGAGAGALTGAVIATPACSGLLGLVLFDFGISYATCVALLTTATSTAGTIIGDNVAHEELARCKELPTGQSSVLARN